MSETLEKLWYCNINPQEQCVENNRQVKHLLKLMGKNRDDLCATLNERQKLILEKYVDCLIEMYCIIERDTFAYGFRLGGRLMCETLSGDND